MVNTILRRKKKSRTARTKTIVFIMEARMAAMFLYGNTIYGVDMETQLQTDIISTIRDIDG